MTLHDTTPCGIREYAERMEWTWLEWSDEDISELAAAAADALRALASRLTKGA